VFDRDGSLVVRGVVPAGELTAMREVFTAMVPAIAYPAGPTGVVWEFTGASRAYPPLAAIAHDPRFGKIAAEALGARHVQLLQDSLLYKPAHDGGAVDWHQDYTYVGFLSPPRVVAVRIALHDEDDANGCMRVVDGSHTWGPVGNVTALSEASVASLVPQLAPAQREAVAAARSLALSAGDISIHHCLTLHASPPNHSDRPRRTIILRMFDAACTLDRARLPAGAEQHFPTDAGGHLDPAAFPIVSG
jgi:ectoine hydroxylase-related dioxygenase (phytanoyl-CoA dioxygenase family)